MSRLVTVVETPEFQRRARALLTEKELRDLIAHVAARPLAGVSIGGGVRKLRYARPGAGKRGGYRVVHAFAPGIEMPVFLLSLFAKNEKADLTVKEAEALRALARTLIDTYRRRG